MNNLRGLTDSEGSGSEHNTQAKPSTNNYSSV